MDQDIEVTIQHGRLTVSCPWDPVGRPSPMHVRSQGKRGLVNHVDAGWTDVQIPGHGTFSMNLIVGRSARAAARDAAE